MVEYGLLLAVLALALVGILRAFRNTVGGVTNRTAVTVSAQAGGGYGVAGPPQAAPSSVGGSAPSPDPDSASAEPDSVAMGGTTAAATKWFIR